MSPFFSNVSDKSGLPPGSLVYVGETNAVETVMTLMDYSKDHFIRKQVESIDEIDLYRKKDSLTWLHIEGLADVSLIEKIGQRFDVHPLVLEDILNTHQRPKFEESENYFFLVCRSILRDREKNRVVFEQISFLVFDRFVISFQERHNDLFTSLILRIEKGKGRIRGMGADYLAYAIFDTIVDGYFHIQDYVDELLEQIEDDLLNNPTREALLSIQGIRREIFWARRQVGPMRESLSMLLHAESPLIQQETLIYYRDVFDHLLRLVESLDHHRDVITGLIEIYTTGISNKMNETMKILTLFSTIFIPLTFITGIYGMNFEFLPELKFKWFYPSLWALFIAIGTGMIFYFKKKKWI